MVRLMDLEGWRGGEFLVERWRRGEKRLGQSIRFQ